MTKCVGGRNQLSSEKLVQEQTYDALRKRDGCGRAKTVRGHSHLPLQVPHLLQFASRCIEEEDDDAYDDGDDVEEEEDSDDEEYDEENEDADLPFQASPSSRTHSAES